MYLKVTDLCPTTDYHAEDIPRLTLTIHYRHSHHRGIMGGKRTLGNEPARSKRRCIEPEEFDMLRT